MLNRYRLFKAGIEANEGIERFNGNAESYEKYLRRFPDDKNYKELCDAINSGDVHAAFIAAHALKGIAGNLSLNGLYKSLFPLVESLRAESLEQANSLMEQVSADYGRIVEALSDHS